MNTVTIPKIKVKKSGGVVILPLTVYEKLLERSIPTYYLRGKAAQKLDRLVVKGLDDLARGKTKPLSSLSGLE